MSTSEKKRAYLRRLDEIEEIETYSPIMIRIREVANDPDASAADLANVILHDHGLTTKVLRLANSAYYAPYSGRIATLTQAVVVMGFQAIKNLALSVGLYDYFNTKERSGRFDFKRFWVHSVAVAVCAHEMAQRVRYPSAEEAFVAGFLHDLGKLVISHYTPDEFDAIDAKVEEGHPPLQAQLYRIGTYHTEVGESVARRWNFPPALLAAMGHHHRDGLQEGEPSQERLVDVVHLGDLLANLLFPGQWSIRESPDRIARSAQSLFRLERHEVDEMLDMVKDRVKRTADELSIPIFESDLVFEEEQAETGEPGGDLRLEYAKLQRNFMRQAREMKLFGELTRNLAQASDAIEVLMLLGETLYRSRLFNRVILFDTHAGSNRLEGRFGYGIVTQSWVRKLSVPLSDRDNLFAQVVRENRTVNVVDVTAKSWRSRVQRLLLDELDVSWFALAPIAVWGRVQAVVLFANAGQNEPISDDRVKTVHLCAQQAGLALERFVPKPGSEERKRSRRR